MSIRREEKGWPRSRRAIGSPGTLYGPSVDLKPSAMAPTSGFTMVSRLAEEEILKQMKDDEAHDPITMEPSVLHRNVFRVQARTPRSDNTKRYFYPNPEKLWRWLQKDESQGRMPETNEKIWFEDWWALYYTFGAPYVPQWAYDLPKFNEATVSSAQRSNDPFEQTPNPYGSHEPSSDEATRIGLELERLIRMTDRVGRLDSPIPEATGIIGRIWLHGALFENPSESVFRARMWQGLYERGYGNWADSVAVTSYSPDPDAWRPNNIYTVYEYEILGLTDNDGNAFLDMVRSSAGNTQAGVHAFFKDLLQLSHTPIVMPRDLPAWAERASRRLAPDLTVSDYEQWSQLVAAEREAHSTEY